MPAAIRHEQADGLREAMRAGAQWPGRQPQQSAHQQRCGDDAGQPPPGGLIEREAERGGAVADQREPHCSRPRARCRRRCPPRRRNGRAARRTRSRRRRPSASRAAATIVSSRAKKAGDMRLCQHMRGQAEREPDQRLRGRGGVGRREGAMLEQQPHDRLAQHDQAERRGQRQPDRKLERARFRMRDDGLCRRPAARASARGSAPFPSRRRRCRAAARSGDWRNRATIPPTARTDAMIAPATISNCGAELATMPGSARARKPRISASKVTRSGVAMRSPRRRTRISSCSRPAAPTVAARASAANARIRRGAMKNTIITAISAMLNSSGENAVSDEARLRARQRQQHGRGAGKGEIRQHQPRIGRPRAAASRVRRIPAPARR